MWTEGERIERLKKGLKKEIYLIMYASLKFHRIHNMFSNEVFKVKLITITSETGIFLKYYFKTYTEIIVE